MARRLGLLEISIKRQTIGRQTMPIQDTLGQQSWVATLPLGLSSRAHLSAGASRPRNKSAATNEANQPAGTLSTATGVTLRPRHSPRRGDKLVWQARVSGKLARRLCLKWELEELRRRPFDEHSATAQSVPVCAGLVDAFRVSVHQEAKKLAKEEQSNSDGQRRGVRVMLFCFAKSFSGLLTLRRCRETSCPSSGSR